MKNIYEEPKLEIIRFNIKERIMTFGDGNDMPEITESDLNQGGTEPSSDYWG